MHKARSDETSEAQILPNDRNEKEIGRSTRRSPTVRNSVELHKCVISSIVEAVSEILRIFDFLIDVALPRSIVY